MGGDRLEDKTVTPAEIFQALMAGSITIAQAQAMYNGVMPIGDYKGVASIFDLDKMVNQPLVDVEQKYMLGILDGREEAYDLVTVTVPITAVAGTLASGSLTVPTGNLWHVNAVRLACPGDVTAGFTMNWHCSLWTDRLAAAVIGQSFHGAAAVLGNLMGLTTHVAPAAAAIAQLDEFGPNSTAWLLSNKIPILRLPSLTVITFTILTDTALPTVATACTLQLFGSMGRVLVA